MDDKFDMPERISAITFEKWVEKYVEDKQADSQRMRWQRRSRT